MTEMKQPKQFARETTAAEQLVRAICMDYPRRAELIRRGTAEPPILQTCLLLNRAVDDAAAQAYDLTRAWAPDFAEIMRTDIADCRGYASSPLSGVMSEGSYKKYKRMIKHNIARRLGLIG